eukprot:CAMPEP_0196141824 /NCGR_PEP_ID=MMETSP0910-20130528/10656_1 /TAXON_ID=49265 /ORGANISM="Thalassiosira rotula, Strain GSO102" /LENGTH=1250 /DNA_ID=CAMNT_0041403051 /DNA_START=75 /DNA_END=3827 /DNA_ORIENTATION=+
MESSLTGNGVTTNADNGAENGDASFGPPILPSTATTTSFDEASTQVRNDPPSTAAPAASPAGEDASIVPSVTAAVVPSATTDPRANSQASTRSRDSGPGIAPSAGGRGLELDQGDGDVGPVPFAQMAASSFEAMEEGVTRGIELDDEDASEGAPVPPAVQIAGMPEEAIGDDNKKAKTKSETADDNEGECPPMPVSQIASRYEEMDAALKDAARFQRGDGRMPPAPGEAERLAEEEAIKRPPMVAASSTVESVSGGTAIAMPAPVGPSYEEVDPTVPPPDDNDGNGAVSTNINAGAALDSQANGQGDESDAESARSTILIPNAYIPEDPPPNDPSVVIVDGYATILLPWWKQTRTRALFLVVCLIAILSAVALGISFSRDTTPAVATPANNATEVVMVVMGTTSPSTSLSPTRAPVTSPPTSDPTDLPSYSPAPSSSPTSCIAAVMAGTDDADDGDAAGPEDRPAVERGSESVDKDGREECRVRGEGGGHVLDPRRILPSGGGGGGRGGADDDDDDDDDRIATAAVDSAGIFVENYGELREGDIYDVSLALSGSTAFVGFAQKDTEDGGDGAGLVYVFEQSGGGGNDGGDGVVSWTKADRPLVPDDGGRRGASFGHRMDAYGDLAVIGAFNEKALYVFRKYTNAGGESLWRQRLRFDVGYEMSSCFLRGDTIVALDPVFSKIHFYRYDRGGNQVVPMQDALVIDPEKKEYGSAMNQIMATGTTSQVFDMHMSEEHLVYSLRTFSSDDNIWTFKEVVVYQRSGGGHEINQTFAFLQHYNASDYEDNFGWELAMHQDVLVIGGGDHTFVFTQRENGYFEEIFQLEDSFNSFQMSDRNAIAIRYDNEVYSMDFADCMQQMPTQVPSSSIAPSATPSASVRPTIVIPTSSAPTSTFAPSPVPTSSSVPSASVAPSDTPTSSSAPTICYDIRVVIMTTGANTEGLEDDVTSWELYKEGSREVILQGGQFKENAVVQYDAECIEQDDYVFNITNSGGNGFGECTTCGYFIFIDGLPIGFMTDFRDVDIVKFRLPLYQRELNDEMSVIDGHPVCSGDFFLILVTDENPQGITWNVTNEDGETVVDGGPYDKVYGLYREFACLPDGQFTFTLYNSGEDASQLAGASGYYIGIEWNTILVQSSLDFNISESTTFVLGPGPTASQTPTVQPAFGEETQSPDSTESPIESTTSPPSTEETQSPELTESPIESTISPPSTEETQSPEPTESPIESTIFSPPTDETRSPEPTESLIESTTSPP